MPDPKSSIIKARVTQELKNKIEHQSSILGIDESEFIRRAITEKIDISIELQKIKQVISDQIDFEIGKLHEKINGVINQSRDL